MSGQAGVQGGTEASRLQHFPVSFFSVVMGLSGLTLAYQKAEAVLRLPVQVSGYLLAGTALAFLAIAALYGLKLIRHRPAVLKELHHPVRLSFFPTTSISLILLGTATLHTAPNLSFALWATGTAVHLAFTLYVMDVWIHHQHFEIHHINPAWFIPVVGNILVPIAGVQHGYAELSWFFFSIGLLFWLVLLTIIFYRMIFHHPLPERLLPTLFILIAPPAVGFISYVSLAGGIDGFGRVLYYAGLFLTFLLFTQSFRFARLRFFLSWWAYSFPLAAITVASLVMYAHTGMAVHKAIAVVLLVVLSLVIATLITKTVAAARQRAICVEET